MKRPKPTPKWVRKLLATLPPVRWTPIRITEPGTYGGSLQGEGKAIVWRPDRTYEIVDMHLTAS